MANVFSLIIKARDQASGILGQINQAVSGLGGAANDASTQMGSLTGAIAGGIIQAQLLGAAFNQVQRGIGFVQGKLAEAASIQTENIQNIGTLASLTGISYEKAEGFVDQLNIKIAELGKTLPVASQDIKMVAGAIQDDLIEAFKTANGVDFKGLETALTTISSDFAVLGKSANVAAEDVQQGLGRFLGGGTQGEYEELNLFARNNALRNEVNRQLKGRKNQDLTVKERVKVLQDAGKRLNTEATKKRLAGSVEGLIANLTDSLFDPDTGIFGFTKDLNKSTQKKESVLTSYNEALEELIGSNGIFTNLGSLLESTGVKLAEPMAVLKSGIDSFVSGLKTVNEALGAAREFKNMGSSAKQTVQSLGSYFQIDPNSLAGKGVDLAANVAGGLESFITQVTSLIKQHSPAVQKRATDFTNQMSAVLAKAYEQIKSAGIQTQKTLANPEQRARIQNAAAVGTSVGVGALALTKPGAITAIATVGGAIKTAATSVGLGSIQIIQAINNIPAKALTTAVINSFNLLKIGILDLGRAILSIRVSTLMSGLTSLSTLTWSAIVSGFGAAATAVQGFTIASLGLLANPIVLGVAAIATAALLIYKYWEPIKNFFAGFIEGLMSAFPALVPVVNGVGTVFGVVFGGIIKWFQMAINWLLELVRPVKDTDGAARNLGKAFGESLGNGIKSAIGLFEQLLDKLKPVGDLLGFVGDKLVSVGGKAFNLLTTGKVDGAASDNMPPTAVGSRFSGQVPSGIAGSLVAAAAVESKNMPAGAKLTVANDSEAIIPSGRVLALAGNNAPVSRNVSVNFAPIFNVQGVSDPQAIAQMALDELDGMLRNYVEGQLA